MLPDDPKDKFIARSSENLHMMIAHIKKKININIKDEITNYINTAINNKE